MYLLSLFSLFLNTIFQAVLCDTPCGSGHPDIFYFV